MTERDAEILLLNGLHTLPKTRVDYYFSEAKKHEVSPESFYTALYNAYERLNKIVNSFNKGAWGVNEVTGEKIFSKNTINLCNYTGFVGTITDAEMPYILQDLSDFRNKIELDKVPKVPAAKPKSKEQQLSFQWLGDTVKELPELYKKMKGQFIADETTQEQFTSIFTGKPIESITPIKWIGTNKLLAYFLVENFKGEKYASIGSKLFLKKSGKQFMPFKADDLTQGKRDFAYGLPKGNEKINEILKAIKKPT